jgi:hypothetical protein
MTIRRSRLLALAAAAAFGAGVIALPPAVAATEAPAAVIRGGHFSPNTPGVDVYLTSFAGKTTTLWLSGVGYGDVSGYQRFTPGLYAVSMRLHGAAASTPAALSWTLNARPGAAYTACAVGLNAELHGIVLHDELQPAPPGQARVRVIQAASRASQADVVATGGPTIARNIAFSTSTPYTTVRAGDYQIKASADGDASVQAVTRASLASDSVHTVVVLDAPRRGISVRVLDDAAGAAVTPVGPAPAGGGGTARPPNDWLYGALAGLVAIAATAVAGASALRKRRTG